MADANSIPLAIAAACFVALMLVGGIRTMPATSLAAGTADGTTFLHPALPCNASVLNLTVRGNGQTVLGTTGQLTASVCGGTPPFRYDWSFNGSVGSWSSNANFTFRATTDGFFPVNLTVMDNRSLKASIGVSVEFYGPSPVQVVISVRDSANSVVFAARVLGGTPPFAYHWTGPGAPSDWSLSPNWTTNSLPFGRSHVAVVVHDLYNYSAHYSLDVVNSASPAAPWYAPLLWPIVGVAVGFAVALTVVYLVARRRRPRS